MARRRNSNAAGLLGEEEVGIKQFVPLFEEMWAMVADKFDAHLVLTGLGYALVQTWSITKAHPVLPIAIKFLAVMAALSNGAIHRLFPGTGNP
eukprot:7774905-Karenia_brevis.AAC.1